ncbi:hypothetical protein HWV62_23286 [Athelia sp. TMB]|nr:hypothetical protein HWV62_23286 [Athelia sp. TMB]
MSTSRNSASPSPLPPLFGPGSSSPPSFEREFATPPRASLLPSAFSSTCHSHRATLSPPQIIDDPSTPPPTDRARRGRVELNHAPGPKLIFDCILVPTFPLGLSKSDYHKPREIGSFTKRSAGNVITVKKPRLNKSIARHHKSLVEVLNHAGNQNAEPIYSRKGKERAIESDANSDKYSADEYTIRVSRPFKRKEKGPDLDDTDYIGFGSQPKKKRQSQGEMDMSGASSSSYRPSDVSETSNLPQQTSPRGRSHYIARSRNKAAPRTTQRVPRNAGLPTQSIQVQVSDDPDTYSRPCWTSLRHLRVAFLELDVRKELWEARYDFGDEGVYTRAAPVPASEVSISPPKARKKPGPKPKAGRPALISSSPLTRNIGTSKLQHKGQPQHSAMLQTRMKAVSDAGPSSAVLPSAQDQDPGSTSADAEGETDLEYLDEQRGATLGESQAGISMRISSQVPDAPTAFVTEAATQIGPYQSESSHISSAILPTASSVSGYSSEEPVNVEIINDFSTDGSGPGFDVLPPGPDLADTTLSIGEYENYPWLSENSAYPLAGNGTIDPSLLGGAIVIPSFTPSPSPLPRPYHQETDEEPALTVNSSISEHDSISLARPIRPPSPIHLTKRAPRPRMMPPEMVPVSELNLSDSGSSSDSSNIDSDSISLKYPTSEAGSTYNSMFPNAGSSFIPVVYSDSTATSSSPSRNTSRSPSISVNAASGRETKNVGEPEAYCHQCRNKTTRPKMRCSGKPANKLGSCRLLWCHYCIERRYPQLDFDKSRKDFVCPKCAGYCNCTGCSRKRGEEYVSTARGPRALQGGPSVQRTDAMQHRSKTALNLAPTPANPTRYWGTIYDSVTGQKITSAYADSDDEDPRVVVPRLISAKNVRRQLNPDRRVFIGEMQHSWGVSGRKVKDLVREGKAKKSGRLYIGKRPPKRRPVYMSEEEEEESDDDEPDVTRASSPTSGSESDLTPLPESPPPSHWLEPQEGQSLSWPPPEVNEETTKKALENLVARLSNPPSTLP